MRIGIERSSESASRDTSTTRAAEGSPSLDMAGATRPPADKAGAETMEGDEREPAEAKLLRAFTANLFAEPIHAAPTSTASSRVQRTSTSDTGGALPYLDKIQKAFGRHDEHAVRSGRLSVVQRANAPSPAPAADEATSTASRAVKVGGATESKKIIRVAWTFDDGPTAITGDMKKRLAGIPATWYVVRNQIEAGGKSEAKLAELKAVQDAGGEIAIHGVHKTESHLAWFRSETKPSYPSIDDALADLDSFYNQLSSAGIKVKFVRLPGGEHSELVSLLAKLGMSNLELRKDVAHKIIKGEPISFEPQPDAASTAKQRGKAAQPTAEEAKRADETRRADEAKRAELREITKIAQAEWNQFTAKLGSLGLHSWVGAQPSALSWQAESSGTGLTDNVTSSHGEVVTESPKRERGKFEERVDSLVEGKPGFLVILAHDTAPKNNPGNIAEVARDIQRMESYALTKKVRIEYYTMSELFKLTRGEEP